MRLLLIVNSRGGSTPPAAQRGVFRHWPPIIGRLLLLLLVKSYCSRATSTVEYNVDGQRERQHRKYNITIYNS
jgi:hypothetical protein